VYCNDSGDEVFEDFAPTGFAGATNNQMELQACISALREAHRSSRLASCQRIMVHTDSMYLVDNYKRAMFQWPKTKWTTQDGAPVANTKQWKELVKLIKALPVRTEVVHVKGHSTNIHNQAVDRLAKRSARSRGRETISNVQVRRKKTSSKVKVGSVKHSGQRLAIRIISSEYLASHRISPYSAYRGRTDFVYSDLVLRSAHSFLVSFTERDKHPYISKLIREITPDDNKAGEPEHAVQPESKT
jgi:ribonuclease HI